jgi:hypothetical protein
MAAMTGTIAGREQPSADSSGKLSLAGAALSLAAFSSSWTGVKIGPLSAVDVFLLAAFALALLEWIVGSRSLRLHGWMLLPTAGAVLLLTTDVVIRGRAAGPELVFLLQVFLGTTLLAILTWSEVERRPQRMLGLLRWWVVGIVLSAAVASLVDAKVISIRGFVQQQQADWRLSGLAFHPNSLALSVTVAMPVIVYLVVKKDTRFLARVFWLASFSLGVRALFLSDSRAGLAVGLTAAILALVIALWKSRARRMALPLAILAGIALFGWALPAVTANTRLAQGAGNLSDIARDGFNTDALHAFAANPIFGGGVSAETGVAVPLQLLSAGGLLLAACYYVFMFRPLPLLLHRTNPFLPYALLTLTATFVFSFSNPGVADRSVFWPVLLAAGAAAVARLTPTVGLPPTAARQPASRVA